MRQILPSENASDSSTTPVEQSKTTEMAKQPAQFAVSQQQWRDHRGMITRLYSEMNLTLKEVQRIMETEYNFKATKRMYMKRLKEWNICKNYRAQQKEELAVKIAQAVAENRPLTGMSFQNRPINLKKVLRHTKTVARERRKQIAQERVHEHLPYSIGEQNTTTPDDMTRIRIVTGVDAGESQSPESRSTPSTNTTFTSENSTPKATPSTERSQSMELSYSPPRPLTVPKNVGNLELIIQQIAVFFDRYYPSLGAEDMQFQAEKLQLDADTGNLSYVPQHALFWTNIKSGIYFLKKESPHLAWPVLNNACKTATYIIDSVQLPFLKDVLATLSPANTKLHPEVRSMMLRYLSQLSAKNLGNTHPLAIICRELGLDGGDSEVSQRGLRYLTELYNQTLGEKHDESFKLRRALISVLRRNNDLFAAESFAVRMFNDCEMYFGKDAERTCDALIELVYIYTSMKEYDKGLRYCREVLQRHKSRLGALFPNSDASYAMENMAELSQMKGEDNQCIYWLTKALESAWTIRGGTASTIHVRDKLEQMLIATGKAEDAAMLQCMYPEDVLEIV